MALMATLVDPFTATSLTGPWTQTALGSATFIYTSQGAHVVFPATTSSSTDGDLVDNIGATYNLTGSFARLNVLGVSGVGATHTDNVLRVRQNASNYVTIFYEAGTLFFSKVVGSSQTNIASIAYDASNHAWWQIRERGGTTYWETSNDGVTWTTQTAQVNPITITAVDILIGGLCFGVDTSPADFIFRYFNYPLPGTTTSTSSTSASTFSTSSTSSSTSSTSSSISTTSVSSSTSSTSTSYSITTFSTSSTSSSVSSTSMSSTSSSTSLSSTSSSISSTSMSSTSLSSTSSSTSISSTSSSFSSTSSSVSSTSFSMSSTSFSSTSSSSSTSTTTLPYVDYTYQDINSYNVVQVFGAQSSSTWICPAGVTSVLAECWGGGGGGGGGDNLNTSVASSGGGGGGYSNNIVTTTPGTSYTVSVGAGGVGGTASAVTNGATDGLGGGDSWFSSSATILAKGGNGGGACNNGVAAAGGIGGQAAAGIGTVTTSGGTGGTGNGVGGSIGGGAGGGGSQGNGGNGGAGTAGNGGPVLGGRGVTSGDGFPPGGSGSGAGQNVNGRAGGGGMVQLSYTINQSPPSMATDLATPLNFVQYSNLQANDGDYFIEYGVNEIIQEFKVVFSNNTGNINIVWKGRSTVATTTQPIYLQIYNQNSGAWETLDRRATIPVDTDFCLMGSQTTNASNYYNSTNTVSCRVYQQVN